MPQPQPRPPATINEAILEIDKIIRLQAAELAEFEDHAEAEHMDGALEAFKAVRELLTTGRRPMFMTLK
jgi:hypothetical protein